MELLTMLAFVPPKVIIYRLCSLIVLAFFTASAVAGLPVRNMNPLAVFVGVPELKSASQLDDDEQVAGVNASLNNHFIPERDEIDPLLFDGESIVGDFFWRRGMFGWEWEVTVPYISYQKGFMDDFVMRWHKALGLPENGRSTFANNQLLLSYAGTDTALLDHPVQGVGDVRFAAGKTLVKHDEYQHALRMMIKLPTGDADHWLGSGGTDIGLFSTQAWQQDNWQEELQLGLLGMQIPDILPAQRRKLAAFMSGALTYELNEEWSAIVQYDAHTALYKNSQQAALGNGQILSFGTRWQQQHWAWHLAVLEDIKVDSAPDVGFQLGFEYGYGD